MLTMVHTLALKGVTPIVRIWEISFFSKTGATQYHAQLGLPDKGRTIKRVGCLSLFSITRGWV